jgi:hypothetical protein
MPPEPPHWTDLEEEFFTSGSPAKPEKAKELIQEQSKLDSSADENRQPQNDDEAAVIPPVPTAREGSEARNLSTGVSAPEAEPEFELGFSGGASGGESAYSAVDKELLTEDSAPAPVAAAPVFEPEPPAVGADLSVGPSGVEKRRSERIRLRVPIRVIGFDEARGRFIEDTHTIVVSESGSLIAMEHRVFPADTVRIINLANLEEADFRVVGPSIVKGTEVAEWGIECQDKTRNIWGIKFPPPLAGDEAGVLLQCRACQREELWPATLLEVEVLERTGMIALDCETCRKATYWIYSETTRRPADFALADAVAPPPRVVPIREKAERRKNKRVLLKLPIRVENSRGEAEILRTEDMSKGGVAISMQMELAAGEIVKVMCPYIECGTNIEQRAEICWRDPYPAGKRRYYGLRFLSSKESR